MTPYFASPNIHSNLAATYSKNNGGEVPRRFLTLYYQLRSKCLARFCEVGEVGAIYHLRGYRSWCCEGSQFYIGQPAAVIIAPIDWNFSSWVFMVRFIISLETIWRGKDRIIVFHPGISFSYDSTTTLPFIPAS